MVPGPPDPHSSLSRQYGRAVRSYGDSIREVEQQVRPGATRGPAAVGDRAERSDRGLAGRSAGRVGQHDQAGDRSQHHIPRLWLHRGEPSDVPDGRGHDRPQAQDRQAATALRLPRNVDELLERDGARARRRRVGALRSSAAHRGRPVVRPAGADAGGSAAGLYRLGSAAPHLRGRAPRSRRSQAGAASRPQPARSTAAADRDARCAARASAQPA